MNIIEKKVDELIPYARNPRKNDAAVDGVAASIKEFGFKQPVVIDKDSVIVVGHTRVKAAKKLGLRSVPCVQADDLTPDQIKAYRLADNKTAEKSQWDEFLLTGELESIDLDMSSFGFADLEDEEVELEDVQPKPPPRMSWVLVGIPTVRYGEITEMVEALASVDDIIIETTANNG